MPRHLNRSACRGLGWFPAVVLVLWNVSAFAQELSYPLSAAVDRSGVVYLADRLLPGVWRLEGQRLSLFFQASKKFRTPLNAVRCLAVDNDGKLLAGDSATRDVYRFDEAGKPRPLTAQGRAYGQIGVPMGIAVDARGDLLVSDLETHRILKVPKDGGRTEPLVTLAAPRGLFLDGRQRLWAISGHTLVCITASGAKETVVGEGVFQFPHTVLVRNDRTAYVCDGAAKTIWRIAPGEKPKAWVHGEPLDNPVGLAEQGGNLLVVDPQAKAVFEIDAAGKLARRPMSLGRP